MENIIWYNQIFAHLGNNVWGQRSCLIFTTCSFLIIVWYLSYLCNFLRSVCCCEIVKSLLLVAFNNQLLIIAVFLSVRMEVAHMLRELLVVHYLWRSLLQEVFLGRWLDLRGYPLLFFRLYRLSNFICLEIFIFLIFVIIVKWKLITFFLNTLFVQFRYWLNILNSAWCPLLLMLALHHMMMLCTSLRRISSPLYWIYVSTSTAEWSFNCWSSMMWNAKNLRYFKSETRVNISNESLDLSLLFICFN